MLQRVPDDVADLRRRWDLSRLPDAGRLEGQADSMTVQPPARPTPDPAIDSVTRRLHQLIDQPIRRSIMERHGLTRVPGTVYVDENGDVA